MGYQVYCYKTFYIFSGQESDTMRPLSYQDAKVFLMYFSVVDRKSFEHIESKWVPEVLAATSTLRTNCIYLYNQKRVMCHLLLWATRLICEPIQRPCRRWVLQSQSRRMRARHWPSELVPFTYVIYECQVLTFAKYTEVSAKTQENLGELFYAAVKAALTPEKMVPEAELKAMKAKKQGCKNQ